DCRTDIWFTVHLGRRLKDLYQDSKKQRDRPIQALVWDYIDPEENKKFGIRDEPSARLILKEINGYQCSAGDLKKAPPLSFFSKLKRDVQRGSGRAEEGTTGGGAWINPGIYPRTEEPPEARTGAATRAGDDEWGAPGWGFAWPANRRILYNRCSADPA